MKRRQALWAPWPLLATDAWAQLNPALPAEPVERLASAWRVATGPAAADDTTQGHHVGVLRVDWALGQVQVQADVPVPSRAHGLLALADGGFLALANRPGRWLLRCDAQGQVIQLRRLDGEPRTLNGHAASSADSRWIFTTETDPTTGTGWISVRDARTLARVTQIESHGVDPHQLLWAPDGQLVVANGGIARDALGRKLAGETMAPSLVLIKAESGRLMDRWTLPDPQLSLRHLAWSAGPERLLGVALQAEHPSAAERQAAPTLAVWDGEQLKLPTADSRAGGYAGDIAAGPGGGFVISAQKQGRGLWWHPAQPQQMTLVAELTEPCALVAWPDGRGVSLSAGRGVARWHSQMAPRMLRWPMPLAPDNHWVRLAGLG